MVTARGWCTLTLAYVSCQILSHVVSVPNDDDDDDDNVCPRQPPRVAGRVWVGWAWVDRQQCHPDDRSREEKQKPSKPALKCVKDSGVDPPSDLNAFMTSLLHERDVTHHMTWEGDLWTMGSGAYADVHMGRLVSTGDCVVIKQFVHSPLRTIEREIRMHRYIEGVLPNTPRLLGILPFGPDLQNCSLVFQLVPDSHTLRDWVEAASLSAVQWFGVALQMALLLERLHRKCVLHNDLHSGNILLHADEMGRRVVDCGVPRLETSEDDEDTRLRHSVAKVKAVAALPRVTFIDFGHATFRKGKVYMGNAHSLAKCRHLAPEARGHEETTPAADVYSLGHELEHIARRLNSSSLRAVVAACTAPDPAARPTVSAVVHTLRKLFVVEHRRALPQGGPAPQPLAVPALNPSFSGLLQTSGRGGAWWGEEGCSGVFSGFRSTPPSSPAGGNGSGRCRPEVLERALQSLKLPFMTFTGRELRIERVGKRRRTLFSSKHTAVYVGRLVSTGNRVVVKRVKRHSDYLTIRYEATINLYLNRTGWVPAFHGVVPLNKYDLDQLGIVQELFAEGVTLADVLEAGRPVGVRARARLAFQLTSLVHDVHASHVLINNLKEDNILCSCADPSDCSDIRVIDVSKAGGCEGTQYDARSSYLRRFLFLAPEVRQKGLTSFASDVYSLCKILNAVLDREAALTTLTAEPREEAERFLCRWDSLCRLCLGADPPTRPSTAHLKQFFSAFLSSPSP